MLIGNKGMIDWFMSLYEYVFILTYVFSNWFSGYALQGDNFSVKFLAVIESISPEIGSSQGGTMITISGDGFNNRLTAVYLSLDNLGFNANNSQISFNTITFTTSAIPEGNYKLNVNVNNQILDDNTFTVNSAYTPIVNSVSPNNIDSPNTQVTISGEKFGNDTSSISIVIGGQNCIISDLVDNTINCTLNGLGTGPQVVTVTSCE